MNDNYLTFFNIFSHIQDLVSKLNTLYNQGMQISKYLKSEIDLKEQEELIIRITSTDEVLKDWIKHIDKIFQNSNRLENYYMLYFYGKSLVKVNKNNMKHYLKFLSNRIQISKIKSSQSNNQLESSHEKIKFIQELVRLNKSTFSPNSKYFIKNTLDLDLTLNLMKVAQNDAHLYLIYIYSKLKVILEPSLVLSCTLKTPWNQIKCKIVFYFLISDFIQRSVMDPNERPYSILNLFKLPKSLMKKIINEYQNLLDKRKKV